MQELLAGLAAEADIVILDSPPATAVADAAILSTYVDGVLMVVDAGTTRHDPARKAIEALKQVNARVIGVTLIVNRIPRSMRLLPRLRTADLRSAIHDHRCGSGRIKSPHHQTLELPAPLWLRHFDSRPRGSGSALDYSGSPHVTRQCGAPISSQSSISDAVKYLPL